MSTPDKIDLNSLGFGSASLDSGLGPKYLKLRTPDPKKGEEKTELVCRLLPAMKSYRADGTWKFFYGQHYGYYGNNPRNPERPRPRPFGCIQKKNRNGQITTPCPMCTKIEKVRAKAKAREAEILKNAGIKDEDGKSDAAYQTKKGDGVLAKLNEWLRKNNCDKKFWINVMLPGGSFGVLQLSYDTCENVLMPCLRKLRDEEKLDAFDPTAGVWLKFTRTGQNPRVKDTVEVDTEFVDFQGKKAKVTKAAPLDQSLIEKAHKICPDLAKEAVTFIPADLIQKLCDSNGDPDEVDRIWPQDTASEEPTQTTSDEETAPALETTQPTPSKPAPVTTTLPDNPDDFMKLMETGS